MSIPATVRCKNPGAMWPGPSATKYGGVSAEHLNDGLNNGAGNQIAIFPSNKSGAAALFDLLLRVYAGMSVRDAIAKWSGGNSVDSYLKIIAEDTGLDGTDRLTAKYLKDPRTGIPFAQAMARHETGYIFPMETPDWYDAHQAVCGEVVPSPDLSRPATLGERILARIKSYLGEREIPGPQNNQHIVEWAKLLGRTDIVNDDFAWCADCTGGCMVLEGAQVPAPDDALLARAYLKVGIPVYDTSDLQPGDIAIWPRPNGMGHVNVVESYDPDNKTVTCIGGNQGSVGEVSRAAPRSIEDALGFTRPVPSKLKPNGTKPITTTIAESPSLKMQLQAMLSAVLGGAAWVWNSFTGDPVGTVHQVNQMMTPTKEVVQGAGIPLTAKVCFAVTLLIVAMVFGRQLFQKRAEPQRQTEV